MPAAARLLTVAVIVYLAGARHARRDDIAPEEPAVNQPPYPPGPSYPPAYPPPRPPAGRPGGPGPFAYGPPPQLPPPPPGYAAAPPPPPRKSSGGKIALIVVGVVLVLLAGAGFAVYKAASRVADKVNGLTGGTGGACSLVSTDDVDAVLGGQWDTVGMGGAIGGMAGGVLDSRVLPDAPSCWGVQNADGKLTRIARYQGGDAAQRFADEKKKAKGATQDKGNGLSVSTPGYLGKDVTGAGDEGFCTTGDMTAAAGALVRRGDTLIYVSTTAAGDGASSVPDINLSGGANDGLSFGTDQPNCDLAVKLIAKVR